jgi:hypothetical protein
LSRGTGYAKAHGLIPTGSLDPNVWGQWVIINTDPVSKAVTTIPTERAAILIAHLHLGTHYTGMPSMMLVLLLGFSGAVMDFPLWFTV